MEDKSTDEQLNTIQPGGGQNAVIAPSVSGSGPVKFNNLHEMRPALKKLFQWSGLGVLVVVIIALLGGCTLLYKNNTSLSQQNKSLSSSLEGYKKANAKPDTLTDTALLPVTSDTTTQPAPAESSTYGGTAVQVNADASGGTTPKYVGGEYAPYWLLTNFAITVPDGMKMVRTTDVSTDGHLLTADNEGDAGCGGDGIFMAVSSTLSPSNTTFKASGSSASYVRELGCGGADPVVVLYAKYYPMAKASQYKYMELVTASCTDENADTCTTSGMDKTKWRLYSGIVLTSATEYTAGDSIQGNDIAKQLYNRDKNGADFYIDCSGKDETNFYCNADDYKNNDYTVALKDVGYAQLKSIILNMHEH